VSVKSKRLLKRIISWSGLFFFVIAVGMLYWQLRNHSVHDIIRAILDIPALNLIWACLACLAGYLSLSLYDFLALRYVGKKISWWKWMLAGMLGFAISNNAGHAVVSGGAIRYRLYTRWRVRGGDIIKLLTYNGITYFLGCAAIMAIGYFMVPHSLFSGSVGASIGIYTLFIFCIAALGAYFSMTLLFRKKKIKIGELSFQIPKTMDAVYQTLIGILDSVLAGLVLYFCLVPFVDVPFTTFIGIFVIAQVVGVFSQVPGGIGVFESIFLVALPGDIDRATIFGALLAYRIIYYVFPLIGMGGLFFFYENWLRARLKRWRQEAQDLIEKLPHPNFSLKNKKDK
jgi:phosphatidylglycerol lysyltransferase